MQQLPKILFISSSISQNKGLYLPFLQANQQIRTKGIAKALEKEQLGVPHF